MEILGKLLSDLLYIIEHVSICHVALKQPWAICGKKERLWSLSGIWLAYYILWFAGAESKLLGFVVAFCVFRCLFDLPFSRMAAVFIVSQFFAGLLETAVGFHHINTLGRLEVIQITVMVIAVVWFYHFVIGRNIEGEIFQLPLPLWAVMGGILFIITLSLSLLKFAVVEAAGPKKILILTDVLVSFAGIAVCGLMIAMAYYFNRTARYRSQKETAEAYNEQQREYFNRLLEREQETRRFRHDMISNLVAVEEMCKRENCAKVKEYLGVLLSDVSGASTKQYDVGNEIVNVIINYYFAPIRDGCKIRVYGIMGEELDVSPNDLCVLASNLAKNAAEAVMQLPEGKRDIRFEVSQGREFLCMYMENTYTGNFLLDPKGRPKTTKSDTENHGYGMKSIAGIAEKYEGRYEVKPDDGRFAVKVFLKVK